MIFLPYKNGEGTYLKGAIIHQPEVTDQVLCHFECRALTNGKIARRFPIFSLYNKLVIKLF